MGKKSFHHPTRQIDFSWPFFFYGEIVMDTAEAKVINPKYCSYQSRKKVLHGFA